MMIVHILDAGYPLCGFAYPKLPGEWPEPHRWVGLDDKEESTCSRCRAKAGLTTSTKHWLQQIDAIYAVIADNEEGEGVVGASIGGMQLPLIAADETRLKNILPLARQIAKTTGKRLRLVKFTNREIVEDI